jgi:hypothetical protein
MKKMVNKYYEDMAPYASLSLTEIFEKIASLPFNPDPDNIELLKRPYYTMHRIGPGGDCDDKAIAMASWAKLTGIPWRFVGTGRKKPGKKRILLSHVYTELYILGEWLNCDCTYSFNILGLKTQGSYDKKEIL